jgi:hypothetical protein
LDSFQPQGVDLSDRIVDRISRTRLDRLLAWLIPTQPAEWWRPALAGALPLIVGVAIGPSTLELPLLATGVSIDWEQAERALVVPSAWDEQTGVF